MGNGNGRRGGAAICGLATLLAGCAAIPVPDIVSEGLLLDHVNVVDVRDGTVARDRAIVVADGRIVRVVPGGSIGIAGSSPVMSR